MFNTFVVGATLTDYGCGYTSAPQILIDSPPFVPTVSIAFSKIGLTAHVQLSLNYIFDTYSNLVNWVATASSFTATNEYVSSEFDINSAGKYSRVRQLL